MTLTSSIGKVNQFANESNTAAPVKNGTPGASSGTAGIGGTPSNMSSAQPKQSWWQFFTGQQPAVAVTFVTPADSQQVDAGKPAADASKQPDAQQVEVAKQTADASKQADAQQVEVAKQTADASKQATDAKQDAAKQAVEPTATGTTPATTTTTPVETTPVTVAAKLADDKKVEDKKDEGSTPWYMWPFIPFIKLFQLLMYIISCCGAYEPATTDENGKTAEKTAENKDGAKAAEQPKQAEAAKS